VIQRLDTSTNIQAYLPLYRNVVDADKKTDVAVDDNKCTQSAASCQQFFGETNVEIRRPKDTRKTSEKYISANNESKTMRQ